MDASIITIGDKISLTKIYNIDEIKRERHQYVSSILDINDDEFLHIGMPMENGHMVTLQVGEKYEVFICTKRGRYQCTAMVIDRYREMNLHVAIVRILSGFVRQQRRQFYRLEIIMEIMHCLYEESKLEELVEYKWEMATLTDISGGGARYNANCHYKSGDLVLLKVVIPFQSGNRELILKSRVISSQMVLNRLGLYETRVEFSEIELPQREAIIHFVFEEERKQRRREKGLV